MVGDSEALLDELFAQMKHEVRRLTRQRLAIPRILATSGAHPTTREVYGEVRVDFSTASLATRSVSRWLCSKEWAVCSYCPLRMRRTK